MRISPLLLMVMFLLFSFTPDSNAEIPGNLITIKAGYVPYYTVRYDDEATVRGITYDHAAKDDIYKYWGMAACLEYSHAFGSLMIGAGAEWQRVLSRSGTGEEQVSQFILPNINLRYFLWDIIFIGAGASGRYLYDYKNTNNSYITYEMDKKLDIWANAMVGTLIPLGKMLAIHAEGRMGYNMTNKQFESYTMKIGSEERDVKMTPQHTWDAAFYLGTSVKL